MTGKEAGQNCRLGIKRQKYQQASVVLAEWVQCLLSSLQCDCLTPTSFIHLRSKHQKSLWKNPGEDITHYCRSSSAFSVDEGLLISFRPPSLWLTYTPSYCSQRSSIFYTLSHSYPNIIKKFASHCLGEKFLRGLRVKLSTETFIRHKTAVSVIKVKENVQMQNMPCIEENSGVFTIFHSMFCYILIYLCCRC